MGWKKTASKYGNRKYTVDGITFDSVKEARRYMELKSLQAAGIISDLQLQVRYQLIPAQKQFGERSVTYIADFVYLENGIRIVEDTKGFKTPEYIIKRKLFRWIYCADGKTVFKEV